MPSQFRPSFLVSQHDLRWLRDTHLKSVILPTEYRNFQFAVLQGELNEPYAVNLYKEASPEWQSDYVRVYFIREDNQPVQSVCHEFDGKTDKPKNM